jgi:GT2 family glycosyltransferase
LLKQLGGFDEQFFYHYEEVDLCRRVWQAGYPIIYTPEASITHLGGQSVNRFPIRFVLESYRNRYRYFYKHYGREGARRCRHVSLAWLRVRQLAYGVVRSARPTDALKSRMNMYRVAIEWNQRLDPVRFIEAGEEPTIDEAAAAQPS